MRNDEYSVSLRSVASGQGLRVLHAAKDFKTARVRTADVNRPALQLAGFYDYFDPKRLQQEMGALYRNAGVNPLAGCLPLLVQMPFLMGMFYALQSLDYGGDPTFLWIENLSNPDPFYILPVLSAVSTYVLQKQTASSSGSAQMQMQMKIMAVVMPLFIGWISCNFAAGLVIYWIVNNVIQILQQWWMYRHEDTAAKKE